MASYSSDVTDNYSSCVGGCGESARAAPRIAVLIGDRTPGKRANGGAGARWLTPLKRPSFTTSSQGVDEWEINNRIPY